MNRTYRQGDILLVEMDGAAPMNLTPCPEPLVLAHGEHSGHTHVLSGTALAFRADYSSPAPGVVSLPHGGVLSHDEHGPIQLPPGCYEVVRQRQYTYRHSVEVDD